MIKLPMPERLLYAIPVLGWMLKDVIHGEKDNVWYFLFAVLSLWGIAIYFFGYPALILVALGLVGVAFVWLLLLTRG